MCLQNRVDEKKKNRYLLEQTRVLLF